jgi:microcystin-dependent protein
MGSNPRQTYAMVRSIAFGLLVGTVLVPRSALAQEPFIGEIRWVAFDFAPRGWATCDGQIMSIAQNTALFSLLGTTYGGNGQTTFALPDMRGRAPLHVGQGPALSNRDLGEVGGTEAVTLTIPEMPLHVHMLAPHTHDIPALPVDVRASSFAATKNSPAGNVLAKATIEQGGGGTPLTNIYSTGLADVTLAAGTAVSAPGTTGSASGMTMPAGGNIPHQNMPPFLVVNCIIALEGIFPSRQ